jgi:hypothetical protein
VAADESVSFAGETNVKGKVIVNVVYGKEWTVAEYAEHGWMGDDDIYVYEFSSEEDAAVFVSALDDAMGWDEVCTFQSRKEASAFVQECLAES